MTIPERVADKVIAQAKSWLGYNEADGSYRQIIDAYNEILTIIQNQPTPKEGFGLRLKTDLTWEEYELPIEPDPDPDPDPDPGSEEDMQMALEVLGVEEK